jgi:hypothetical protein
MFGTMFFASFFGCIAAMTFIALLAGGFKKGGGK